MFLTFIVILQWGEKVTNNGDAPGAPQDFLPLTPGHVVHICVVFGESKDPGRFNRTGHQFSDKTFKSHGQVNVGENETKKKNQKIFVCILYFEKYLLFHFSTPQVVFFSVHGDGERSPFPLSYGVWLGGDGADFVKL